MEAQTRRTIFMDRPQMLLTHSIIRIGRDALHADLKKDLRTLEGKIMACRLSAYNGHAHVLTLTEQELYALRQAHQEYCAQMAHCLLGHETHLYTSGGRSFDDQLKIALAYRDTETGTLRNYQEASDLLRIISSL